jgi:hypothetical protein
MLRIVDKLEPYQIFVLTSQKLLLLIQDSQHSHSLFNQANMHDTFVSLHHCCMVLQHLNFSLKFQHRLRLYSNVE